MRVKSRSAGQIGSWRHCREATRSERMKAGAAGGLRGEDRCVLRRLRCSRAHHSQAPFTSARAWGAAPATESARRARRRTGRRGPHPYACVVLDGMSARMRKRHEAPKREQIPLAPSAGVGDHLRIWRASGRVQHTADRAHWTATITSSDPRTAETDSAARSMTPSPRRSVARSRSQPTTLAVRPARRIASANEPPMRPTPMTAMDLSRRIDQPLPMARSRAARKRALCSGRPTVIRRCSGIPYPAMGRTITPSASSAL